MKVEFLCQTPIAHAPCIIRRSVVEQFGPALYNERCSKTQDYELWSRLIKEGVVFGMVSEPIYLRRCSQGAGANPIRFQVIHNQVARRNMRDVLRQVNIDLPNVVSEEMITSINMAIKNASGLLKSQLKMIQCILYSNVYSSPIKRILAMIRQGDIASMSVLSLRLKIHFCLPDKLTEMNNMVTAPDQYIFND